MQSSKVVRNVRIFRYDPVKGGEGTFQSYQLTIDNPETTTILDVLLRIQKEQDPSISFRFACRVNMCGSCGMVINGTRGWPVRPTSVICPPIRTSPCVP